MANQIGHRSYVFGLRDNCGRLGVGDAPPSSPLEGEQLGVAASPLRDCGITAGPKFDIRGFATPGTILAIDSQRFYLTLVEPYIRKDGTSSHIAHWEAECARCGEGFEQLTGLAGHLPRRRCEPCRKLARSRITKRGKSMQIRVIPA